MDKIKQAIVSLQKSGIVIFPTDTAFGIGCRVDSISAISRLFALRNRPETQATPVLVNSIRMAEEYFLPPISYNVRRLMAQYWPGALTIILPCDTKKIPKLACGGGKTIGLRIPNHKVPQKLITEVGVPILGPSANFHGGKTPYTLSDIEPKLLRLVDHIIPGKCQLKNASTVVDCSAKTWHIVRQGAVIIDKIDYPLSDS